MDTKEIQIVKYNSSSTVNASDIIVREEPLEVYINSQKKYFCMRMPGMDYELAAGLMYNEGIINSLSDIESYAVEEERISFKIRSEVVPGVKKVYASSGSMFSDELVLPASRSDGVFNADELFTLQRDFFKMQKVFDRTGGVHASAFYSSDGRLISFAEDVGRHNALDKCLGQALASGMEKSIFLILLSSRISFEMIRKSFRTGAVIVAGVSAPTSAAVSAAEQSDMTLIGFLRGERFNLYSHPKRVSGISS